ncbi:MAG: hypothetical protein EOL89_12605 [Actinobacteria bacterium]|nr:hypothetical protein [Actinomycetota bacterium]
MKTTVRMGPAFLVALVFGVSFWVATTEVAWAVIAALTSGFGWVAAGFVSWRVRAGRGGEVT